MTKRFEMSLSGKGRCVIRSWGAHTGLMLDDGLLVNSKSIGTAVDLFDICLRFCSTLNIGTEGKGRVLVTWDGALLSHSPPPRVVGNGSRRVKIAADYEATSCLLSGFP